MEKDFNYYKRLVGNNELPDDFDQWLMSDHHGNTLAHFAANEGILPTNWTDKTEDWLVSNHYRNTIAHVAANSMCLPSDWTKNPQDWLVEDEHDFSIAMISAIKGKLPPDWTTNPQDWLTNYSNGETVAHYAAKSNALPANWTNNINDWLIKDKNGNTIAHEAYNILPVHLLKNKKFLDTINNDGVSILSKLIERGCTPKNFRNLNKTVRCPNTLEDYSASELMFVYGSFPKKESLMDESEFISRILTKIKDKKYYKYDLSSDFIGYFNNLENELKKTPLEELSKISKNKGDICITLIENNINTIKKIVKDIDYQEVFKGLSYVIDDLKTKVMIELIDSKSNRIGNYTPTFDL